MDHNNGTYPKWIHLWFSSKWKKISLSEHFTCWRLAVISGADLGGRRVTTCLHSTPERQLVPCLWTPVRFSGLCSLKDLVFPSLACGGSGWQRMRYKRGPKHLFLPKLVVAELQHQQAEPNKCSFYCYFCSSNRVLFLWKGLWWAVCGRVLLRYYTVLCNLGFTGMTHTHWGLEEQLNLLPPMVNFSFFAA